MSHWILSLLVCSCSHFVRIRFFLCLRHRQTQQSTGCYTVCVWMYTLWPTTQAMLNCDYFIISLVQCVFRFHWQCVDASILKVCPLSLCICCRSAHEINSHRNRYPSMLFTALNTRALAFQTGVPVNSCTIKIKITKSSFHRNYATWTYARSLGIIYDKHYY